MSGSSGTNTVTQEIPSWMQSYISNTYQNAENTAAQPYTPYSGEAVAPLNATQQQGLSALNQVGQANTGMSAINSGVTAEQNAAGYNPTQVGYQAPTAANIQQYMSPYTNDVINSTNAQIQEQGNIANQQTAGNATSAGAYGGSRQGVQTALNNQYTGMTMASTDAGLENQNYAQALGQANTNAQSNLAASTTNAANGLTANQQQLLAGNMLGSLGAQQSSVGAQNANDIYTAGATPQSIQQQQDTYNYNQYMQQMMWPYQQLSALESGTYGGNAGSSTTSPLYSNTLGQVAGLGMSGLGLAGSLGAFGGGAAAMGGGALAAAELAGIGSAGAVGAGVGGAGSAALMGLLA